MPKIDELFAFIVEDSGPDDEGVAAQLIENVWLPMIGADLARVESLKPAARGIGLLLLFKVFLERYSVYYDGWTRYRYHVAF